jgi:hypothetical protein
MKTKKKRGRPCKEPHEIQTEYLDVRLVTTEKEAFKTAASMAGMPLSMWVRDRLRAASKKELVECGKTVPFLNQPDGSS